MINTVSKGRFYYVARDVPHAQCAKLDVGLDLSTSSAHNPFFAFYELPRVYPVTTTAGDQDVKAIRFLSLVRDGTITCPTLPQIASEIATHYVMLARELIMEEVRREVASDAPSRQTCLWVVQSAELARYWQGRLGGQSRILEVELDGVFHTADANWLLGDSEPLSVTYDRARRYWLGEISERPEMECLFSGTGKVVSILL